METSIKESKFGDIILWNKINNKFIVVRNYYKLPNLLKTNNFEICCMSLGNESFISLNQSNLVYDWYAAMEQAKVRIGSAPIKPYLPSIDELKSFYPLINGFNRKINKLNSLGVSCDEIRIRIYWSSTECSIHGARYLYSYGGFVYGSLKYSYNYVRAFVAF